MPIYYAVLYCHPEQVLSDIDIMTAWEDLDKSTLMGDNCQ